MNQHWIMAARPRTESFYSKMYSSFQNYFSESREKRIEDQRVAEMRNVIARLPLNGIDRAKAMRSLASALRARFFTRGSTCLHDLEEAITLDYHLVLRIPLDDPMRPLFLEVIAHSLFVRFEHLHKIEDLENCIKFYELALALPQCTEREKCEKYLANAVKEKADVVKEKADVVNEKADVVNEKADVVNEKADVVDEKADVVEEKADVLTEEAEVVET